MERVATEGRGRGGRGRAGGVNYGVVLHPEGRGRSSWGLGRGGWGVAGTVCVVLMEWYEGALRPC
jgi:hypothetical protein